MIAQNSRRDVTLLVRLAAKINGKEASMRTIFLVTVIFTSSARPLGCRTKINPWTSKLAFGK